MIGDQLYLKGLYNRDLLKLEVATYFFPFDKDILIGPAQYYFIERTINDKALAAYKDAVYYDPYSVQFLGVHAQIQYLAGNKNEALIAKQKLQQIAPNSNILKRINEITKGLK